VTTHDSLGYFARRYGVEVVGELIPSRSTQAQASARDVDRLVRRLRREGVKALFPESALNPKLERAVARDAGVEVGKTLFADALGGEGSGAETYLAAFAHNAAALVEGMTGGERSCPA
jgi:ABC-type Zn uptake system ZnuABC Zn-binding protein ZnuA